MTDPQYSFRTALLHLAHSYARLVALSYGFQHAFGKNDGTDENPFLTRVSPLKTNFNGKLKFSCFSAWKRHPMSSMLWLMVQLTVSCSIGFFILFLPWHRVGPYFRHGPEAQSVFVTFASAFLVKVNNIFIILNACSLAIAM